MDFLTDLALQNIVYPLIGVAIVAVLGWLGSIYTKWTGKQIEANDRAALQSALENGVRLGLQFIIKRYTNIDITRLTNEQKTDVLSTAASYVQKSVPDAVKNFGLSTQRIQELAQPKLPVMTPEEAAKLSSTGTVVSKDEALKNG